LALALAELGAEPLRHAPRALLVPGGPDGLNRPIKGARDTRVLGPLVVATRTPEKEFLVAKASPYKGRKPSLVKNFWIYRRLIALAFVLGLMLWFIWANDATVTVAFPFGLGKWTSTTGLVILLSALVGSVVTALG